MPSSVDKPVNNGRDSYLRPMSVKCQYCVDCMKNDPTMLFWLFCVKNAPLAIITSVVYPLFSGSHCRPFESFQVDCINMKSNNYNNHMIKSVCVVIVRSMLCPRTIRCVLSSEKSLDGMESHFTNNIRCCYESTSNCIIM